MPEGPKPGMTQDLLLQELTGLWKSFLGLACPEPLPCKFMEVRKRQQSVHPKDMEKVRGPDSQSQGPWEFSFAFSPASQSVYFPRLFNIHMNQDNIIS